MNRRLPEVPEGAAGNAFSRLLDRYLRDRVRPKPGRRWTNEAFATACNTNERTVRFWRSGTHLPNDLGAIETALFGDAPPDPSPRQALRDTYDLAKSDRVSGSTTPGQQPLSAQPTRPDRCFGREAETATLLAALTARRNPSVLVLGGPGIGKTTLTRQVATSDTLTQRFADRRWFVELETVTDAAALRSAIVQALGLSPADTAAFDQALAKLRQAPSLLVLDNLETPWEADMTAVHETLRQLAASPDLALLASLRGGEAPDSPAWSHVAEIQPLPREESRRLFRDYARKIQSNDPLLDRFLAALGGVPLAVELVAKRAAPAASLTGLWQEWQRRGVELAKHVNLPDDHRQHSLLRSIDLSLQSGRLRDEGKELFRLLGASPAGMAPEDIAGLLANAANEAARQLLAIGLAFERGNRLDLLPPVRDAAQRLAPVTEAEADAWCRHYLGLVAEQGRRIGSAGGAEALTRLAPEMANFEAAFTVSHGDRRELAVTAVWGFHGLQRFSGVGRPAILADLAASCRATTDAAGEARCHFCAGVVAFYRSDHDAARDAWQRALPLYQKVGEVLGEANCIQSLDDIALARSEHDAARDAYQRALPLCQKVGSVLGAANCIMGLGDVAERTGDKATARKSWLEALALYQRIADPYSIGWAHHRLAGISDGDERAAHITAARQAWASIDRPDLIAEYLDPLD